MAEIDDIYLSKAEEGFAGAESELVNGRYNNCANRCYYSCFQAAIAALIRTGIRPSGQDGAWSHAFVQAQFAGTLITRRKLYPSELRDTLSRAMFLRQTADYKAEHVTQVQAGRAIRNTRRFLEAIQT